jgi:cytochrome c oxidase accessory protein FixG
MSEDIYKDESFRDKISTVDQEGKRVWINPKKPSGRFYNKRAFFSYGVIALLFIIPFIKINGEPFLLFNIIERKFIIFGKIFWPQDFYLFALMMITAVVFIILFTVVFGRLFCGWACPQTVFMEMVFRKIEYLIEGDWQEQKRLKESPWTNEKIWKRSLKLFVFYLVSFTISNVFLSYIIGVDGLAAIVTDSPANHMGGLISILIFSAVFFFVFAYMREQVCIAVCPYGRLQGVLLDKNSIVVAYDHVRGEKRDHFKKGEDRQSSGKGDCVDCHQCVHVCPTGIDIRNGTQLECTNCTACIDACDSIMDKLNMKKGLIRYASENAITEKQPLRFTRRIKAYTAVLSLMLILVSFLLISRKDISFVLLRSPGTLYQEVEKGRYSNTYNFNITNKTNREMNLEARLIDSEGEIRLIGTGMKLKAAEELEGVIMVILDTKDIKQIKTDIKIGLYDGDKLIRTASTTFIGPGKIRAKE